MVPFGRVPVVREQHLVAAREGELGNLGAEVARAEDQLHRQLRLDPGDVRRLERDDVAGVHDQPRLVPVRFAHELAVRGQHDNAVGRLDGFLRPGQRPVLTAVQLDALDPRVAVDDVAAALHAAGA